MMCSVLFFPALALADINVIPSAPTANDNIVIEVSGTGDYELASPPFVLDGNILAITLILDNGVIGLPPDYWWSVDIGLLPPGDYIVEQRQQDGAITDVVDTLTFSISAGQAVSVPTLSDVALLIVSLSLLLLAGSRLHRKKYL